jgi:hypothetical protein
LGAATLPANYRLRTLELGVRWALKDGVTIPITQDRGPLKFNVANVRVIPYGQGPDALEKAIEQIVDAATIGLNRPGHIDSPVRDSVALIPVTRAEWEALESEIAG